MSEGSVGLLEPATVPTLVYVFGPVATPEEIMDYVREPLAAFSAQLIPVRVVSGRGEPTPSLLDAIALALQEAAPVIAVPTEERLGPVPIQDLLDRILPELKRLGIRLVVLPPSRFDTADPGFLAGLAWSVEQARRVKAASVTKKYPPCVCNHRVFREFVGEPKGHKVQGDGAIGPCWKANCGCSRYRPRNERLLKQPGK